jgi:hypothetical protein
VLAVRLNGSQMDPHTIDPTWLSAIAVATGMNPGDMYTLAVHNFTLPLLP